MPVCAGLVWNKDQDELFTKYLQQMDEYTGVCKLKNTIRKVSAWLFLEDRGTSFQRTKHVRQVS